MNGEKKQQKPLASESDAENLLLENSKKALDASLDEYDQQTLERLDQARMAALDAIPTQGDRRSFIFSRAPWLVGGFASVALAAVITIFIGFPSENESLELQDEDLFLTLMEEDNMELLEQDSDFYLWLEVEDLI